MYPTLSARKSVQSDESDNKVYLGELSQRALTGSRGIFRRQNPYPAPLALKSRALPGWRQKLCLR